MDKQFLFSVIIPVYNAEDYLHETITSVLEQTIGFEENIQLILVNDGSRDKSLQICREYAAHYPDNIEVIDKENGGVSSARNAGIEAIRGKYVNFLDADDKWEKDSFLHASCFFEEHESEVDVAAAQIRFFDAAAHEHKLNYKFDAGTRVCDITREEEYYSIQSTVATTFIKASSIEDLRFDTEMKYGEDAVFVNKIILKKHAYGLLADAWYMYRRRAVSAVASQWYDRDYYLVSPVRYHKELKRYCKSLYGRVLQNTQSLIIYDAGWRVQREEYQQVLNAEETEQFHALMREVFSDLDDELILGNRRHRTIYKLAEMMELKHGGDFFRELTLNPNLHQLEYRGCSAFNLYSIRRDHCVITEIRLDSEGLLIHGKIARWLLGSTKEKARFGIEADGHLYKPQLSETVRSGDISTGTGIHFEGQKDFFIYFTQRIPEKLLQADIHRQKKCRIRFMLFYGRENTDIRYVSGKFLPCNDNDAYGYHFYGEYCLRFYPKVIEVSRPASEFIQSVWYEMQCFRDWRNLEGKKELSNIRLRLLFEKLKKDKKKEIWLISDRVDNAGDNGEVFFRYVVSQKPKDVRPVFVIGKEAACVSRLKELGEVVFFDTDEYRKLFLLADKVISSGASEQTINAFGENRKYMKQFYDFKFYYLQHGVACADLSSWLNKENKNIHMLFTSARKEYEAFLNGDYGYTEEQVKLTGMARFDALRKGRKKQILILPTWRRSIYQSYNESTQSVYYSGFVKTEFYQFYNSLINDPRLLEIMRIHGYSGLFCLHPIHKEQYVDFEGNDVFRINAGFVDYNQVFQDAALTVTDYSSVLFDFAYLRKPVIYTQFDKDAFFEGQIYGEGYFDYDKDGFGPVCCDYESTVKALIEAVERDCALLPQYRERLDSFFAYSDQRNCERIYKEIKGYAESD
ncbi:MAG: CDP-glycerol glycerophosphotransferase family protein [Lachnospiraceae bacterium]|nr:CDP-glycerol glycerophosphotransferase family protein [Lachnospiraceae bacterium]